MGEALLYTYRYIIANFVILGLIIGVDSILNYQFQKNAIVKYIIPVGMFLYLLKYYLDATIWFTNNKLSWQFAPVFFTHVVLIFLVFMLFIIFFRKLIAVIFKNK